MEGPAAAEGAQAFIEGGPGQEGEIVLSVGSPFPRLARMGTETGRGRGTGRSDRGRHPGRPRLRRPHRPAGTRADDDRDAVALLDEGLAEAVAPARAGRLRRGAAPSRRRRPQADAVVSPQTGAASLHPTDLRALARFRRRRVGIHPQAGGDPLGQPLQGQFTVDAHREDGAPGRPSMRPVAKATRGWEEGTNVHLDVDSRERLGTSSYISAHTTSGRSAERVQLRRPRMSLSASRLIALHPTRRERVQ